MIIHICTMQCSNVAVWSFKHCFIFIHIKEIRLLWNIVFYVVIYGLKRLTYNYWGMDYIFLILLIILLIAFLIDETNKSTTCRYISSIYDPNFDIDGSTFEVTSYLEYRYLHLLEHWRTLRILLKDFKTFRI